MQIKNNIVKFCTAVAVAFAVTVGASAQTTGLNSYSPYTMYGIGEIHTPGTLATRSMGGAGIAMYSGGAINLLNPAAQSSSIRKSVLFNFEGEGGGYYLSQMSGNQLKNNSYNNFNINNISFQMPLYKGVGMAISVSPFSSIGYNITGSQLVTNIGEINYLYSGSGDITQVRASVGWEPIEHVSIGAAVMYYWGGLSRNFMMTPTVITGSGTYSSTYGQSDYYINNAKFQLGAQWRVISDKKRMLVAGATYDFGGNLNPELNSTVVGSGSLVSTIAKSDTTHMALSLPKQLGVGVYYQTSMISLAADYIYQDWIGKGTMSEFTSNHMEVAYTTTNTMRLGVEYTPNRADVRSFFKRVAYRGGVSYGDYYQTWGGRKLKEWNVNAGISLPIKYGGLTKLDLGVEYGSLGTLDKIKAGTSEVGLIKQNHLKLSIGLSLFGDDYWFQRPKYD